VDSHIGRVALRRLRDAGPQTRSQLADHVEVPRTTLTTTLRSLVDHGLVEDGPVAPSSGGRRSVTVQLPSDVAFAAVSVGERRTRVALLTGHLSIVAGVSTDLGDHATGDQVAAGVLDVLADVVGDRPLAAVGLATVTPERPWVRDLAVRVGAAHDGVPVAVVPAVHAMALGERHSGAARGRDDVTVVRLGHGVTTATIARGDLLLGARGRAGAIGHLRVEEFGRTCECGRTGCLDSVVGVAALVERATDLARRGRSPRIAAVLDRGAEPTLADLVAAAEAGDGAVAQVARDAGQRLGQVLGSVAAATAPGRIVLGGPVAALGPHLIGDVRAAVHRVAPPTLLDDLEVVLSDLGERAIVVGTTVRAVDAWIESATNDA
jgi:predicted NBD/HSP70 family sugar kinase